MSFVIRTSFIVRKWGSRAVAAVVVGELLGIDEEGRSPSPDIVHLPICIGKSPFISDSDVLRVGAPASDVCGTLGEEEVHRHICCKLWHIELSVRSVVDPRPKSAIFRDLPSVWWKLMSRKLM